MRMLIHSSCARLALALAFVAGAGAVVAQTPAPAGPPAGFVAPAEPKPDETNAERGKSQPGNNAPFWRSVRESGSQQGYTSLPGAEMGILIQPFVQYPGSRVTNAGEAWRQVRNQWLIPYGGSLLLVTVLALAGNSYRISFGAVAPRPVAGERIEALLQGQALSDDLIQKALGLVPEVIVPITDIRATKEYRLHMVGVMLERGLRAAVARLGGTGPDYGTGLI